MQKGNLPWIGGGGFQLGEEGVVCVCLGEGVLLGERGMTKRELSWIGGGSRGGIGAELNVAERSVANRSVA